MNEAKFTEMNCDAAIQQHGNGCFYFKLCLFSLFAQKINQRYLNCDEDVSVVFLIFKNRLTHMHALAISNRCVFKCIVDNFGLKI